jgi:3D (Asp-Asp-Asp) domain-containing protein
MMKTNNWLIWSINLILILAICRVHNDFYGKNDEIAPLKMQISHLEGRIDALSKMKAPVPRNQIMEVTAYTPSKKEGGPRPGYTACQKKARPGWTAAVGENAKHMMGHKIYVEGLGVWHVRDIKGINGIDLCVGTVAKAKEIGKSNRTVAIID